MKNSRRNLAHPLTTVKSPWLFAAQDAVNDSSINWDELFTNQAYALYEEYGSVDDFREEVNAGDLKAKNIVARIYRDKGWGFLHLPSDV